MDDDYFNEKISLDDLYTREKEVKNNKIKTFQKILTRVHKKIRLASRNVSDKHIFFLVPEFIIGVPSYDVNVCTSYLMEKLSDNGFKIKYTHPNLLYISWEKKKPQKKTKSGNGKTKSKSKSKSKYRVIDDYEPSGNFIYTPSSLTSIKEKTKFLLNN